MTQIGFYDLDPNYDFNIDASTVVPIQTPPSPVVSPTPPQKSRLNPSLITLIALGALGLTLFSSLYFLKV